MKKNYWYIILGLVIYFLIPFASRFCWNFLSIAEMSSYNLSLSIIRPVAFIVGVLLTALTLKRRTYGWSFLAFFLLAFLYPTLMGKSGLAYNMLALLNALSGIVWGIAAYLAFDWFNKYERTKELEQQNLQSELTLLKNQLNPHFLFNTLNNIDTLIKVDGDKASHSLVKLSGMMRYMLYETNVDQVPLSKELAYVEDYLALQQLQYVNSRLVEYNVMGNASDSKMIAPMLFIPFIENAFKHTTDKEQEGAIRILFDISSSEVRLKVENRADEEKTISKDRSSGIGLETVRRRLDLLYPGKYRLDVLHLNGLFCATLSILCDD